MQGGETDRRLAILEYLVGDLSNKLKTTMSELDISKNELFSAQETIKHLQEQASTKSVIVDTRVFATLTFTRSWLLVNVRDPSGYMFFLDAHSMLAIAWA